MERLKAFHCNLGNPVIKEKVENNLLNFVLKLKPLSSRNPPD